MNYKLIIIVFILLLFPNSAIAELPRINISIDIQTREYQDAFVVGDTFYYKINLTNPMTETIYSDFSVSIYNPANVLIESTRNYTGQKIEPNKSIEIVAKGGYINETAAFPFDIAGDYRIVLESSKSFDFYRNMELNYVWENKTIPYTSYVRTSGYFVKYFDVMPSWQYHLWKEEEKINMQSLDLSQKMYEINTDIDTITKEMNQATQDMNKATKNIEKATYGMVVVALISLFVAYYRR